MTDAKQRARALEPAVRRAMEMVVFLRNEPSFEVFAKGDESPVTSADFWANEFLLTEMDRLFPGEIFIGEESDDKSYPPGVQMLWYVDPIDGTKNYISGHNPFHILIGLCVDGEPSLGLCAYPTTGDIIVGGVGFRAESWSHTGSVTPLKEMVRWTDSDFHTLTLKGFSETSRAHVFSQRGLRKADPVLRHPSMMGPAFGISTGYMDHRTIHWWDLCGPAAIMQSLGYRVGRTMLNSSHMNDGSLNTNRFHCLPPDTPAEIVEMLYQI